jgi:hypothetical protein
VTQHRVSNDRLHLCRERTRELRAEIAERSALSWRCSSTKRISLLNQITQIFGTAGHGKHSSCRPGPIEDHRLDLGSEALCDPEADTLNVAALRLRNSCSPQA